MDTIFKYELQPGRSVHMLPEGSEVLSAKVQHNTVYVWVRLNRAIKAHANVEFYTFGTGHEITTEAPLTYIDTVMLHGGSLVFHVFYRKPA